MTFKNKDKTHDLYVKPNSLYIMSGDSRYLWTHEMMPKNMILLIIIKFIVIGEYLLHSEMCHYKFAIKFGIIL